MRSRDNRWAETLRVDAYLGDAHAHWFADGHLPREIGLGKPRDDNDIISAVCDFLTASAAGLLAEAGFPDVASSDYLAFTIAEAVSEVEASRDALRSFANRPARA